MINACITGIGTLELLAPLPAVEIGWSEAAKQYRKCIGKRTNGKPRIFWLGRDEADAKFTASMLSWCQDPLDARHRPIGIAAGGGP